MVPWWPCAPRLTSAWVEPLASLSVIHLVRNGNGWDPFDRFMRSYEQHPAGIPHQLLILAKGFDGSRIPEEYRQRVSAHAAEFLPLADTGFDIGSYWAAAQIVTSANVCFLNSFSVVLDDGWLAKMVEAMAPLVGIVGATGSWESHLSTWAEAPRRGLLLPPWRVAPPPFPPRRLTLRDRAWLLREWLRQGRRYPPFPNPHVRTNAFLMRTELARRIEVPPINSKQEALAFESGWHSLTRQIVNRGLAAIVVGRDGVAYPPDEWPRSRTFRAGEQENLLIADKRTEEWLSVDPETKDMLARHAWGSEQHRGRLPRAFRKRAAG
jgi:hypothetical protein